MWRTEICPVAFAIRNSKFASALRALRALVLVVALEVGDELSRDDGSKLSFLFGVGCCYLV